MKPDLDNWPTYAEFDRPLHYLKKKNYEVRERYQSRQSFISVINDNRAELGNHYNAKSHKGLHSLKS